jgi:hypothetical protein
MQLQQEQMDFYQNAISESKTAFGESQQLLSDLQGAWLPILQAGPNQYGFSDAEDAALNASAVKGTAENYERASKALNEHLAANGGVAGFDTTGGDEALKGELASDAARQESTEQLQIKEAGYQVGRENFEKASNIWAGEITALDPVRFEDAATGSGKAAGDTAAQIAQANNAWINAAIGAVGALGSSAITAKL